MSAETVQSTSSVSEALDENTLSLRIKNIKFQLKKAATFKAGIDALASLIPANMNGGTKRLFYDSLNMISFRIGKRGYNNYTADAQRVMAIALEHKQVLTPGYRKNIEDWKETIDKMISDPSAVPTNRTDGRFGTSAPAKPRAPRARSIHHHSNSMITDLFLHRLLNQAMMRNRYGSYDDDSDDDDDDEGYGRQLNWGRSNPWGFFGGGGSSQDSDDSDDSDDDGGMNYLLFNPKALSSGGKHQLFKEQQIVLLSPSKLPHANTGETSAEFTFTIKPETSESLKKNVFLSCHYTNETTHTPSPSGVSFILNGSKIDVKTIGAHGTKGYMISSLCKSGDNIIKITSESCICKYSFAIGMIAPGPTAEELSQRVKKDHTIDYDTCLERVIKSFNNDSDVMELSRQISIRDPLSQMRVVQPARGKNCGHVQCFDLLSYLQVNEQHPKFLCPVCNRSAPYEELVIDSYVEKLLASIDESMDVDEVEINPQGEWKIPDVEEKKKRKATWGNELSPAAKISDMKKRSSSQVVVDLTE